MMYSAYKLNKQGDNIHSFPNLEPACCYVTSCNCDLHTDFSGGRSGGLVFPSLKEFSTVYCDPHSQNFAIVNKAETDVFLDDLAFSMIQRMLAIRSLVPLPFLNPA